MTDKQDPIANAARLLREAAEELRQAHTLSSDRNNWIGEPEAKDAYDEHIAAAQALEDWELAVGAGGVQARSAAPAVPADSLVDAFLKWCAALDLPTDTIPNSTGKAPNGGIFSDPRTRAAWGWETSAHRFVAIRRMLAASPTPPAEQQAAPKAAPGEPSAFPMTGDEEESDLGQWQPGTAKPNMDGTYLREFDEGEATSEFHQGVWLHDGFFPSDLQDVRWRGRAAPQQEAQEPVAISEAIERMAADRYKVVSSHESMFHRWAVVAGTGTQQLYLGREVECQNMSRKFAGAFLDGAFVAMQQAAPQQEPASPIRIGWGREYQDNGKPIDASAAPVPDFAAMLQQGAQEPCPTCAALARAVVCDQVSFDRKPDCYGIRQITDDEGVEEWEDIRTSPDVAREEANDMMATGRGEIYEVVPLWTTPQPSLTAKAADSVLEDAARLDWLALAGPVSICVVIDRPHDGEVEVSTDDVTGYGKTLREAIDTALAAQERQP